MCCVNPMHLRGMRGWAFGCVLVMLSALLAGCGAGEPEGTTADPGITKSLERGPIALVMQTDKSGLNTSETLSLTLRATVDDGYSVAFPDYPAPPADVPDTGSETADAEGPAAFSVLTQEDLPPDLLPDGRVTRGRVYTLEPFLEGSYEIPPLQVTFWKEEEGSDAKSTVDTEPIVIAVASVIPPGEAPEMKDIAGPVALREPAPWGRYVIIFLLLAALAAAGYWYWFRYTPPGPPPAPPVPPHQRALEALDAVKRLRLVEQGLYKEYYIRVSDVLRHYMEEQFQLRAPERTTEEFLDDLQHNAILGLQEQLLLREFLRHCDLVKFARVEPTSQQISDTFTTCERFIIDSNAAFQAARRQAEPAAAGGA
jgi:hypothetical protein